MFKRIREYIDNGINPIVIMELRRARKTLAIMLTLYFVMLTAITAMLIILPLWNNDFDYNKRAVLIFWFFLISVMSCFSGAAQSKLSDQEHSLNGDETFRLIPIPYWERFCSGGILLGLIYSSICVLLPLPFIAVIVLFDWNNVVLLLVPAAQFGLIYLFHIIKIISYGCITPFRKKREAAILSIFSFVLIFGVSSGITVVSLLTQTNHPRIVSGVPLVLIPIAMFLLVFINGFAAAAYFLIRYHLLTHPKQRFRKLFAINAAVYTLAMLIFTAGIGILLLIF